MNKYSQQSVWFAIEHLIPSYKEMREGGIANSLPEALKAVAAECFIKYTENTLITYKERIAMYVVRDCLMDLKEHGRVVFGDFDINDWW